MKITVFHGSPRKGNTYHATKIFMDELQKCGDISFTEFYMPKDLPTFCTGCTLCHCGQQEKCPSRQYIAPILESLLSADALVFATPHYGACSMPASMKNLLDHLDFMVLNVAPREENFHKKAFIITTGAGSAASIKPIKSVLKHWGINRVYSLGFRMRTNLWDRMPKLRQEQYENRLRKEAQKFHKAKKKRPYLSTIGFYHISKLILKKYVGEGNYPYENWKEKGYFKKRPF
ncbi:MAG: NAD(P)H-dependent oxidoreductase [Defluviitaleaceae bacterium]|nr:NAD(P)H-dependent oxidoreductase [Defluviitaleaceae bacterium]